MAFSSTSDCSSRGSEFEPQPGHITFIAVDHYTNFYSPSADVVN